MTINLHMKSLKIIGLISILTVAHYSCSNDETEFIPSQTVIIMEGEGGTKTVTFENANWRIAGVINKAGQRIFGEIFDREGQLVKENSLLELDGLGKLDAPWANKGFNICRKTINSLQIELYENATGEEFNFSIIIENDGETKEIHVNQKISEGYSFEGIEYYLTEYDKDEIYHEVNMEYIHNIPEPVDFEISPFGGVVVLNTSYFMSDNTYAFLWFNENRPEVEVPISIYDGKISLSDNKKIYGEITKSRYEGAEVVKEIIPMPAGKSKFNVELEWRNRQVSYRVTMKNKRTGDFKTIEGKWLETTPTGKYTIIRDY